MKNGQVICEPIYNFSDSSRPEFLSKFYKTYKENGEICYTNEISEEDYEDSL